MARLHIKVNTAGSWASLGSYDPERIEYAKLACESLAVAGGGNFKFKVCDADGTLIEQYNHTPEPGRPFGWHRPQASPKGTSFGAL